MTWLVIAAAWANVAAEESPPRPPSAGAAEIPGTVAPGAPPPLRATEHQRISVNLQNVEVRAALQLIADFAGVNLVVGEGVAGTTALRLRDTPWDEALNAVLASNGLGKRRSGDILLVAPAETIAAREQAALASRRALAELAPLRTEFIHVRYAQADHLAALFAGENSGFARSERGRVLVDARTNALIVTETTANLAALRDAIARLDVPVRQVRIEARVVNANNNFAEQLGVRWRGDALAANLSVTDKGTTNLGINLSGLTRPAFLLDLELSALAEAGEAEIIARPNVVTADKRAAVIETGVEIPYQQSTHAGGTSISFKDAVLRLQVTPQVTPERDIALQLEITQDTVGKIYYGVPSINTTRIATRAVVADGETVVLGGIFQTDRHHAATRTPLLGELPVFGRLFRRTLRRDDQRELFVFITPAIIDNSVARAAGEPNPTPPDQPAGVYSTSGSNHD